MRQLLNILIGVMLIALLAGAVWHTRTDGQKTEAFDETFREVQRLKQQIHLRSTLRDVPVSQRGYPLTIDPAWFDDSLPQNLLLIGSRPWLEIASEADSELKHPRDPVAVMVSQAMFWYNPHTGAVRARVPASISEAGTLEAYNRVNGTSLSEW